ncbi:hypothetical protein C8R43DRAFT_1119491 [Mycena crocata]|nr:hypothetical protein C8R43DRAFT_1119491 [Mycena crocata]
MRHHFSHCGHLPIDDIILPHVADWTPACTTRPAVIALQPGVDVAHLSEVTSWKHHVHMLLGSLNGINAFSVRAEDTADAASTLLRLLSYLQDYDEDPFSIFTPPPNWVRHWAQCSGNWSWPSVCYLPCCREIDVPAFSYSNKHHHLYIDNDELLAGVVALTTRIIAAWLKFPTAGISRYQAWFVYALIRTVGRGVLLLDEVWRTYGQLQKSVLGNSIVHAHGNNQFAILSILGGNTHIASGDESHLPDSYTAAVSTVGSNGRRRPLSTGIPAGRTLPSLREGLYVSSWTIAASSPTTAITPSLPNAISSADQPGS